MSLLVLVQLVENTDVGAVIDMYFFTVWVMSDWKRWDLVELFGISLSDETTVSERFRDMKILAECRKD